MFKCLLSFGVGWFIFISSVFAQTNILDQKISVDKTNATIQEVLTELSSVYKIDFSYSNDLVHLQQKLSIKADKQPLREVLNAVLVSKGIRYSLIGSQIILQRANTQFVRVYGYVSEANTGEILPQATVYDSLSQEGALTNTYGYYSLRVPAGQVALRLSYIGYQTIRLNRFITHDTLLNISLKPTIASTLNEVTIKESIGQRNPISTTNIPVQQLKLVPMLAGEPDVIKSLALTPGVGTGVEASAGLFIRGGSPDQNLILLDEAPVYNATHLFGFVSVFNPDAIKDVQLIKGGFPARYGGRLSSVVDVIMKEGNNQKLQGEASIGLIGSRFTLEGPLAKGKTSFLLSGRASYLGLFLLPANLSYRKGKSDHFFDYWLYDVNAKINHKIDDKSQLFLSFYTGKDIYRAEEGDELNNSGFNLNWGNLTTTLRYRRALRSNLFGRMVLLHTRYQYGFYSEAYNNSDGVTDHNFYTSRSTVSDNTLKMVFDWLPGTKHQIQFGTEVTRHTYRPNIFKASFQTDTLSDKKVPARENAFFVEDDWQILPPVNIRLGGRLSVFKVEGKQYHAWEPRLTLNWDITPNWALRGAYSRMQQYLHLLSSNGAGFPNDLWVPATQLIPPQRAQQWGVGLTHQFNRLPLELTLEGYLKKMNNLIDYKPGTNLQVAAASDWQQLVESHGNGHARGLEVMLRKTRGSFTGWVSYTWSKSEQQFTSINNGQWYPNRYDRRHSFAVTGQYKINDKWNFASTWVYASGHAVTLPTAIITDLEGQRILLYSSRNNQRMPATHRLDLGLQHTWLTKRNREASLSFGLYNAYNHLNPLYINYSVSRYLEDPFSWSSKTILGGGQAQKVGGFPILPYVSYSVKF